MPDTRFVKLNHDWNAEPNDPGEQISFASGVVELAFNLNPWAYEADEGARALLYFSGAVKWRLGSTNDEGWYRGQCRYGKAAPEWGEFYEIGGSDPLRDQPNDWHEVGPLRADARHFLFYLRDNTFECIAADWSLRR
ncbi:hypothetical protein [Sphingomonas bacterium]|uniref:hypothetical protein n=1 Tax=Sphingomonas bacterium TaxID=1895847 RepID=UPI00260C6F99|nr:hypothetical protein [Sphingomonas bacterium]MDB5680098.1 hypothetical protein [Sphingomonas bacterium]